MSKVRPALLPFWASVVLAAVIELSPAIVAPAIAKNWNTGTGNWNVPGNWNPASIPVAGEQVNIVFTDGVARTVTYNPASSPALGLLSVDLTGAGTAASTLSMPSSINLNAAGILVGGYNGSGVTNGRGAMSQAGGTTTISAGLDLALGHGAGSTGTYTLSGGALVANQNELIGISGTGTFNHNGGTNTLTTPTWFLTVGTNAGSTGTYNLSGTGAINSNVTEYVGYSGMGTFNQTGGTNTINSDLIIGFNLGSTGNYTISNSAALSTSNSTVGSSGTGTLTIQDQASVHVTNTLSINNLSTVNLNGGTLRFNDYIRAATGTFNFNAGTIKLAGSRTFGFDADIQDIFGALPAISSGKALIIEGNTDIQTNVAVNGGALTGQSAVFRVGNSQAGSLSITNGGTVVSNVNSYIAVANAVVASANVAGPGSNWTTNGALWVGVEGIASMNVTGGGTVNTTGDGLIAYDTTGPINTTIGNVLVSGAGSVWNIGDDLGVGGPAGAGTLTIEDQGLVYVANDLFIDVSDKLNLNGGTIRFDDYLPSNGSVFNFNAGTIQLAGDRSLGADADIQTFFGAAPTMPTGKGLTVEGTATLLTAVTLDGGTFTASSLASASNLHLQHGTLNVTNQILTVGPSGTLGAVLELASDMTVNSTLGIISDGLVTGDGAIGGSFQNTAAGELRAEPGKSLKLTGANNTNAGQISLYGGMFEFTQDLTNDAGAFISGNGTIIAQTGLVNQGTMNFAGTANVVGAVTNSAGGKIISGGGGATIFFDDVTNNGEIRTSANGFTVFFGSYGGAGTITGTGTVNFESVVSPGSSPASIQFGGDVALGLEAELKIEIGGTVPGTQHDQLDIAGDLALAGALEILLLPGFTPTAGQSFNILDWDGTLSGTFSELVLPTLVGLAWNTSQLYTNGIVSLAAAGLPGDYNADGIVDAVDYTVWRNNLDDPNESDLNNNGDGGAVTASDYTWWKQRYGDTSPGSGGLGADAPSTAVPEPAGWILWLAGTAIGNGRWRLRAAKNGRRFYCPKVPPRHLGQ